MAATSEQLERMVTEITLGIDKRDSLIPMTPSISETWDQLEREIREIRAQGLIVDNPAEVPAVVQVEPQQK